MAMLRLRRSTWANAAVLLALALLAAWLLALQPRPWFETARASGRWWLAAGALLAYAAIAAWFARPRRGGEPAAAVVGSDAASTLVAYASQTGFAQQLAERTAASLRDAGRAVRLLPLDAVDAATLAASGQALIVASTTGEGDPPDHALSFVRDTMAAAPTLAPLQYAVLALGDRNYRNYCAFGHQLDAWLRDAGATPLFDLVEVDNGDAGALRHWQHHLAVLTGAPELPDWTPARYAPCLLLAREHINPGSMGGAVFHLSLQPPAAGADWQAGDIAEVGPRNPPQDVAACLARCGLRGDARVAFQGEDTTWEDALSRAHLGALADAEGLDARALAQRLQPLPHREYSIASLPADGSLQFILRRMLRPDGTPGLASGWLCDTCRSAPGSTCGCAATPTSMRPIRRGR